MIDLVSKGQLTRQELGWLLTQEAQGAAERLRVGVQVIRTSMPPAPLEPPSGDEPHHLDATLDALDDAMRLLSSLHQRPPARSRRGRIDLAALVFELAPDARVAIEPGSGTEVFGDEEDLRRMLQVLVGRGADQQVSIRREGDEVCVVVSLGSEGSPTQETERAWLSRMAVRYGGRHELEGDRATLWLPADGVSERNEREALRRELDEAKKQGAAYARELAQVFETRDERTSSFPALAEPAQGAERAAELGRFCAAFSTELKAALAPVVSDVAVKEPNEEWLEALRRRVGHVQEIVEGLSSYAAVDARELPVTFDAHQVAAQVCEGLHFRSTRGGVTLSVSPAEGEFPVYGAARALEWVLRKLVGQALASSPKGGSVGIVLEPEVKGVVGPRIHVDDAGPPLPAPARAEFLALRVDPMSHGRVSGVTYHLAAQLLLGLGASFELSDAPGGGLRASILLPKRDPS